MPAQSDFKLSYSAKLPFVLGQSISTGIQSLIPQLFFLSHYPAQRHFYMPIAVGVGALGAIIGLRLGRLPRLDLARREPAAFRRLLPLHGAVLLALLGLLWETDSLLLHFLGIMACQAVAKSWEDTVYRIYMKRISALEIGRYSDHVTIAQAIGMAIGPIFFARFYESLRVWALSLLVLALGSALAIWSALRDEGAGAPETQVTLYEGSLKVEGMPTSFRWFLAYVLNTRCAAAIFGSSLVYVAADYYGASTSTGGFMVTLVNAAGGLSILVRSVGRHRCFVPSSSQGKPVHEPLTRPPLSFKWITVAQLCAVILLLGRASTDTHYIGTMCIVYGAAYWLFLSLTRAHASAVSLCYQHNMLITRYNEQGQAATFIGLGALSVLGRLLMLPAASIAFFTLSLTSILFLLALSCLWLMSRAYRLEQGILHTSSARYP